MGRDERVARTRFGADTRPLEAALKKTERGTVTWAQRVKKEVSSAFRGAFGGLGGVAGLAGVAGFGAIAREVKQFNDRLVRLQISSGRTRGEMLKFNDAVHATAQATGATADDVLRGAEKYQELTGRFGEYEAAMSTFAKVTVATGASMDDISTAAAALSENLKVNPGDMITAFEILGFQGKAGAVELRNLAEELTGVTGQFSRFNAAGVKGAASLGAWLQVLRKRAPSAAEAATQLSALMGETNKDWAKVEGKGVKVFLDARKTKMRDLADIATDFVNKVPESKWGEVYGRKESLNALQSFKDFMPVFLELRNSAGATGMIMRDFNTYAESAGGKMAKAHARMKAAFNEALLKNLDAMVSAFESLVKALSWIAEHPKSIAALMLLWKGGGMLGNIAAAAGGMAGAASGVAGAAAAAGGASRAGVWVGRAGGMMQGAGIGLMLAQMAPRVGGTLDLVDDIATTTAGALAALPGPIGAAGKAAILLKGAFDLASHDITKRQDRVAKETWGSARVRENRETLLGTGRFNIKWRQGKNGPESYREAIPAKYTGTENEQRAAAETMSELYMGGAGVTGLGGTVGLDPEKARKVFKKNHPEWSAPEIDMQLQAAQRATEIMMQDPEYAMRWLRERDPTSAHVMEGPQVPKGHVIGTGYGPGEEAAGPTTPGLFEALFRGLADHMKVSLQITTEPGILVRVDPAKQRSGAAR